MANKNNTPKERQTDKRGIGPITVLEPTDFSEKTTLAEKVNKLVENRCDVFMHNVMFLCEKHNLTQAQLCYEKLQGQLSPPQLAAYKNRGRTIPLQVMALISSAFGLTIEEMCGQLLDKKAQLAEKGEQVVGRPTTEYEKYVGTYDLAYFDTSKPVGENFLPAADSINNAVMTVYATRNAIGIESFHVAAIFNCTSEEREKIAGLLDGIDLLRNGDVVYRHYESVVAYPSSPTAEPRMKCLYVGDIQLTDRMTEITLRQVRGSDTAHLLAHNRSSGSSDGKKYKGGLATLMSVSRGTEHMPCIQAVLVMSETFREISDESGATRKLAGSRFDYYSEEQIANALCMAPPKIEIEQELDAIISYMKVLFDQKEQHPAIAGLSDEDKKFCLENFAEKKLTDSLRRNILSYYKVAIQMDSDVYQMMKLN